MAIWYAERLFWNADHVTRLVSLLSEQPVIGRVRNDGERRTEFSTTKGTKLTKGIAGRRVRGSKSRFCPGSSDMRSLLIATFSCLSCLSWFQPTIPAASLLIAQTTETDVRIPGF